MGWKAAIVRQVRAAYALHGYTAIADTMATCPYFTRRNLATLSESARQHLSLNPFATFNSTEVLHLLDNETPLELLRDPTVMLGYLSSGQFEPVPHLMMNSRAQVVEYCPGGASSAGAGGPSGSAGPAAEQIPMYMSHSAVTNEPAPPTAQRHVRPMR